MGWIHQTYRFFSGSGPAEESDTRFWSLARKHSEFLYNMALRYTGNPHDAEDLLQDTLYIGFNHFKSLRNPDKIRAWLFRIMRNRHIRLVGRKKGVATTEFNESLGYTEVLEQSAAGPNVTDRVEQKSEAERLLHLVSKLPEKYQTPLLLFYMEEMTYKEISKLLEIPLGTVMSRLSRARNRLKAALVEQDTAKKRNATIVQYRHFRTG